jgi:hypothetical protein
MLAACPAMSAATSRPIPASAATRMRRAG